MKTVGRNLKIVMLNKRCQTKVFMYNSVYIQFLKVILIYNEKADQFCLRELEVVKRGVLIWVMDSWI
jgi:hypothetical protein